MKVPRAGSGNEGFFVAQSNHSLPPLCLVSTSLSSSFLGRLYFLSVVHGAGARSGALDASSLSTNPDDNLCLDHGQY